MPSQNLMVVSKKNRGERPLVPKKIRIPKTDGSSVSVNPTREPKKAPTVSLRFLVLDSQTGEQRGDYVFDPEQYFNAILCFTRSDGYTVYAIKGGQAAKQTLPLR